MRVTQSPHPSAADRHTVDGTDPGRMLVTRPPLRVILAGRAAEEINEHLRVGGGAPAGGLLIGRQGQEEVLVSRALRCQNSADAAERASRFSIDPRVVQNVRRSLQGTDRTVMGIYRSSPGADHPHPEPDWENARVGHLAVQLLVGLAGEGLLPRCRAWWSDGGAERASDIPVEILALRIPLRCPE